MVTVRAFKAVRPVQKLAKDVACFPYDVINSDEARKLAAGNPLSFLHVEKPEIDLPPETNLYSDIVYDTGKKNLYKMIDEKILFQEDKPCLYIYKEKMGSVEQYGIVACVSADEYNNNKIKKHEFTRKDKEDDRTRHIVHLNAQTGPVFLTYRDQDSINKIVSDFVKNQQPEYDFVKEDNVAHTLWIIKDQTIIDQLVNEFKKIDSFYIADGHHRSASAVRAQAVKKQNDPNYSPDKEYNYFLAAIFPASHLYIMDYNRILFSLNGNTPEQFMAKIQEKFDVIGENTYHSPKNQKEFGMYMNGKWYQIRAKAGSFPANDPVESLDCAILQNNVLCPILGVEDPRTAKNIDFVGGIRGHKELEDRVNSGEGKVAFKLHPVSIKQLMDVSDADKIMPPKSTWFEPKIRSGLFIHLMD